MDAAGVQSQTVTLTLENAVVAQLNTFYKFVRSSDGMVAVVNVSTGATTDGATFATTLAQQFTAAAVADGDLSILAGLSASSNGTVITITADQAFTVAATDANTQGILVDINDDTPQASALSGGFAVSAAIANATVTLTGPTDAAFSYTLMPPRALSSMGTMPTTQMRRPWQTTLPSPCHKP